MTNAKDSLPTINQGHETGSEADFLNKLGARVRETREQRGLARRVLARQANVSERYLAQLEAGAGNISVVLLRRIAHALGIPLTELLSEGAPSTEEKLIHRLLSRLPEDRLEEVILRLIQDLGLNETARNKRIALIGLRGAGKSTLGAMLAKELNVPFVELHKEIERDVGLNLNEIFELYGQSGYRRIERRVLEQIIKANDRVIISVGGGIVSEPDTYKLLLSNCFTVWLKAAPEEHMARVVAQGDFRPMEGNKESMDDLRRILAAREPLYSKADIAVDTSGESPEASLQKLTQAILVSEYL